MRRPGGKDPDASAIEARRRNFGLNRRRSVGVKDPDEPDVRIVGEIFERVGGIVKHGARDGEGGARVAAQTALAHRSIFSFENGPQVADGCELIRRRVGHFLKVATFVCTIVHAHRCQERETAR